MDLPDGLCWYGDFDEIDCKHLQRTSYKVRSRVGPIGTALRESFLTFLFRGEDPNSYIHKIKDHSRNRSVMVILYPHKLQERRYSTPEASCGELVTSILGGKNLNFAGHRECIRKAIVTERKEWEKEEIYIIRSD